MLIELRTKYTDLEMGQYVHFASSMHVYEADYGVLDNVISNVNGVDSVEMPLMKNLDEIKTLQRNEALIRSGRISPLNALTDDFCLWCQKVLIGDLV